MAKKEKAKIAKVIKKATAPKVEKPAIVKDDLAAIAKKRDSLIAEIQPKLLSNSALKRGGFGIRGRHAQEQSAWNPVIGEINDLGAKLGLRPLGLGQLRK